MCIINLAVEYALGGLSSNIFASKYTYYIPDKEQLIAFLLFCQWYYLLPAFAYSAAVQTIPTVSSEIHSQKATKKSL